MRLMKLNPVEKQRMMFRRMLYRTVAVDPRSSRSLAALLPYPLIILTSVLLNQPTLATGVADTINLSTGFDRGAGQLLANGVQDVNYTLTAVPAGVLPPVAALVGSHPTVLADSPPAIPNTYLMGSSDSRWLGVINSVFQPNSFYLQQGNPYVFQASFDLTGFDPLHAQIDGLRIATDNKLTSVLVNGTAIFSQPPDTQSNVSEEFMSFRVFADGLGQGLFHSGTNSVQFLVQNSGLAPSPLALRVEGRITVLAAEPGAFTLVGLGLVSIGVFSCGGRPRLPSKWRLNAIG
jgi:hypothetical protein